MTSSSASSIRIGPYHLGPRIGEGGAGEVFRAEGPDGAVAVKLLGAEFVGGATETARFRREIEALAKVAHPSLVRVVDHGVDEELGPYIVTPLVPGRTLREVFRGQRVAPEGAIVVAERVAAAAAALHASGFVHRDPKPENVIGTPRGEVIVIDLGLACGEGGTRHTSDGVAVGSVGYMAPEQIEGREVGPAADVWAIGVMIYEWVAGKRPFARARASEEAAATLVGAFTPLAAAERRCGAELAGLVEECLRASAAARPSAEEVARRLRGMIDWTEDGDAARAAVIEDAERYVEQIASFRARRLERVAREEVDAGRPFAALALLDRALAYEPGRKELEAIVAEVERASGGRADVERASGGRAEMPTEDRRALPARASAWRPAMLAAVAAAAIGVGATYLAMRRDAPAAAPRDAGVVAAAPADASAQASPLDDLPPIPLDQLSNTAEPFDEPRAPEGEPIVDPTLLAGRTPDEAVKEVDDRLAANPGDVETMFARALVYLAAGRERRGVALLDEALRLHPTYQAGWSAAAYVEIRRGRYDAAERAFERALALDASDATALRNRGILRHRLGRVRDAYGDLRQALAVDPGDVEAMYELVQLYARADRQPQTRALLERIVRMRPTHAIAWLDLSLIQPPAEALASVRKGLELAPEMPRAHQRLCNVLVMLQDTTAKTACDHALALDGTDAATWEHRGIARYLAGDDRGALDDLTRACELDVREACGALRSGSTPTTPLVP